MFVRTVKKNNDHVSIRIVENKRQGKKVKQKTICCIGHTHKKNTEKIELFKRIGKKLIPDLKSEKQTTLPGIEESWPPKNSHNKPSPYNDTVHVKNLKEEARIHIGCSDIFGKAYDQLKLTTSFGTKDKQKQAGDLLKEIVLSRLESPLSLNTGYPKI